ncbi:MAG: hypothetical protein WC712_12305 [Candidatus Brocadiia bacterium]
MRNWVLGRALIVLVILLAVFVALQFRGNLCLPEEPAIRPTPGAQGGTTCSVSFSFPPDKYGTPDPNNRFEDNSLLLLSKSPDWFCAIVYDSGSVRMASFSYPDGKLLGSSDWFLSGLLPGRDRIGLYLDFAGAKDEKDASLFVLESDADLKAPQPGGKAFKLPRKLTAGPPGYTLYTGSKWWIMYGEDSIVLIDRQTGKTRSLSALFGEESRCTVSDDLVIQMKLSRTDSRFFLDTSREPDEPAYYADLSVPDSTWKQFPFDMEHPEYNPALWIPVGRSVIASRSEHYGLTQRMSYGSISEAGEMNWEICGDASGSVTFWNGKNVVRISSEVMHNAWRPQSNWFAKADYFDPGSQWEYLASGISEYRKDERWTVSMAVAPGRRLDSILTKEGFVFRRSDAVEPREWKSAEGFSRWNSCVMDGRFYCWTWTIAPDNGDQCNISISELGKDFMPGVFSNAMDYIR